MTHANRENRVAAAAVEIRKLTLSTSLMIGGMRIPADVARKLAEVAVDAVIAADNTEAERRAEVRRQDAERRRVEDLGRLSPADVYGAGPYP